LVPRPPPPPPPDFPLPPLVIQFFSTFPPPPHPENSVSSFYMGPFISFHSSTKDGYLTLWISFRLPRTHVWTVKQPTIYKHHKPNAGSIHLFPPPPPPPKFLFVLNVGFVAAVVLCSNSFRLFSNQSFFTTPSLPNPNGFLTSPRFPRVRFFMWAHALSPPIWICLLPLWHTPLIFGSLSPLSVFLSPTYLLMPRLQVKTLPSIFPPVVPLQGLSFGCFPPISDLCFPSFVRPPAK